MDDFFQRLPKAELHLHLEGSIGAAVVRELDSSISEDDVRRRFAIRDFAGFIEAFKWVVGFLRTPDDYALATRRLLEKLERENVLYAEITLAAGVILWRGQDFASIYDAVTREAARSKVQVWWVLDVIRHFGPEPAMTVARWAADRAEDRVVAFGIGGDEARGPAGQFREVFEFTRGRGLRAVPHAGENTDARSVWDALEIGADRIGHGIRAIEDPRLVTHLAEQRIPLEVCVTSNLVTGAVRTLEEHPVRRLWEAGVPVILNSDDPGLFGVSISDEYRLAEERLGFSRGELEVMAAESFRYGFRWRELPSGLPGVDRRGEGFE